MPENGLMAKSKNQHRLTSILLVEERLLEADFFIRRLRRAKPDEAGYFLNAFLSAARAVTFLLQREMAHVPGFPAWWDAQRETLRFDAAARFFLELRNFSQKAGRVSLTGVLIGRGRSSVWTYRFVDSVTPVPKELRGIDAADACADHVAKMARVVLACMNAFPYHSCPSMALSPAGMDALGLDVGEMFRVLQLPYVEGDDELALRVLRRSVDRVDVAMLRKLASPRRRRTMQRASTLESRLLARLEARLQGPGPSLDRLALAASFLDVHADDCSGSSS